MSTFLFLFFNPIHFLFPKYSHVMNFNFVAKIQLKNLIFHFLFITKINENKKDNIKV